MTRRTFRASDQFHNEIININNRLNLYLQQQSNGSAKRLSIPKTLDLIFSEGKMNIIPEQMININKRKQKKIIFRGEMNI